MSDSLIRNLRDLASCAHADLSVADEAADEIERLREALRDIACDCEDHCDDSPYGHGAITPNCCRNFARAALGEKE